LKRNGEVVVDLADRIKKSILDGSFSPGDSLPESKIIDQFGCSRTSAREALRTVIHSGLAVKTPNRSYRVASFDETDVHELTSLRLLLEQQAVRIAFGREAMVQGMGSALDELRIAVDNGDHAAAIKADRHFHEAIVNSSGHRRLAQAYLRISDQIEFAFRSLRHWRRSLDQLVVEHEKLYDLVRRGIMEEFVTELGVHIQGGLAMSRDSNEATAIRPPIGEARAPAEPEMSDTFDSIESKVGELRW
jgi:DNA-binding GntR family transcriptional regulator